MSAYLNQVVLIGRVGKKPEIAQTNDGKKIAKFSLATSEHWKDKETMERKEKTEWHRIVIYSSKIAEVIEQYVEDGALVCVEGKLKYEKWTNAQGVEQKATTIVVDLNGKFMMLDRKSTSNKAPVDNQSTSFLESAIPDSADDEIPF